MVSSTSRLALVASIFALPVALAAYDPSADDNIAIYWGTISFIGVIENVLRLGQDKTPIIRGAGNSPSSGLHTIAQVSVQNGCLLVC
jgi:hypothetical protein